MGKLGTAGIIILFVVGVLLGGGSCFFAYEDALRRLLLNLMLSNHGNLEPGGAETQALNLVTNIINSSAFIAATLWIAGAFIVLALRLTQTPED